MANRQLAAIMFTDIVGYTALMGEDEEKAFELLKKNRLVQRPIIERFNGRWIKEMGDGVLASFTAVSDAVYCAGAIQKACDKEADLKLRIGIHLGEVVFEGEDVFGDGVNIASRLEPLAPIGGILVSESVHKNVLNKKGIETEFLREENLKNVREPVRIYQVRVEAIQDPARSSLPPIKGKPRIRNGVFIGIGVVFILLVGYIIYQGQSRQTTEKPLLVVGTELDKSIAVLPFKTIGSDQEGAYFAEGVREEILNHLSRIEGLHIKSRTVVDRFKDRTTTTQELVSELKLTHYLEGSARKEGNRVRITVQFIDANNNEHLWAENFDRNYENIWDTQSEIAKKVAEELRIKISTQVARVIEKRPTDNLEAWDDYLKAMSYARRMISLMGAEDPRSEEEGKKAVEFLKSSIRKDPDFALGYANLAWAYLDNNPDSALILCNKAIELDPLLSLPYSLRGAYEAFVNHDTIAAIRDFNLAISNGPHRPISYWALSEFYRQRGDVASALKFSLKAIQRQPEPMMLPHMLQAIGLDYLEVADYPKAEYYLDKALVYDPDNLTSLGWKAHLYRVTRQYDLLFSLAQRILEVSPSNRGPLEMGMYYLMVKNYEQSTKYFDRYFAQESEAAPLPGSYSSSHMYGYALLKTGRLEEANNRFEIMKNLLHNGNHATEDYEYAKIYSAKGMIDSAYFHLEKVVAGSLHWGLSDFMERDPLFNNIKDEPKFQRLVGIAKEKVRLKREEVRKLEESGEIPISLVRIELY